MNQRGSLGQQRKAQISNHKKIQKQSIKTCRNGSHGQRRAGGHEPCIELTKLLNVRSKVWSTPGTKRRTRHTVRRTQPDNAIVTALWGPLNAWRDEDAHDPHPKKAFAAVGGSVRSGPWLIGPMSGGISSTHPTPFSFHGIQFLLGGDDGELFNRRQVKGPPAELLKLIPAPFAHPGIRKGSGSTPSSWRLRKAGSRCRSNSGIAPWIQTRRFGGFL